MPEPRPAARRSPAAAGPDSGLTPFDWVAALSGSATVREQAVGELHGLLVRVARVETVRRSGRLGLRGPELDDVANQAADDALVAVLGKIDQFRGDSQFTTWAYKFVIFEVANKVARHHWQRQAPAPGAELWDQLPARLGSQPEQVADFAEMTDALRRTVEGVLSMRQRRAFVAVLVNGMPIDVFAQETGSNRNAVYKMIFDARRKIRAALVADGYIEDRAARVRDLAPSPDEKGSAP